MVYLVEYIDKKIKQNIYLVYLLFTTPYFDLIAILSPHLNEVYKENTKFFLNINTKLNLFVKVSEILALVLQYLKHNLGKARFCLYNLSYT